MKSILTVIAAVLVIHGKGAANDTGGMEKIIPKIEFTGADPRAAFETLIQCAEDAGAMSAGFKGIAIDEGVDFKDRKVTFQLREIPLHEAIAIVTRQFGQTWRLENDAAIVGPHKTETLSFPLNERNRAALNLPLEGPLMRDEIAGSLQNKQMAIDASDIKIVSNSVIATAERNEILFLRSFLNVVSRGLKIE